MSAFEDCAKKLEALKIKRDKLWKDNVPTTEENMRRYYAAYNVSTDFDENMFETDEQLRIRSYEAPETQVTVTEEI